MMDAYEQEKADKSVYARIRREQCEALIMDIRNLRDFYLRCSTAALSRNEFSVGDTFLSVAEDLNLRLARVGENN